MRLAITFALTLLLGCQQQEPPPPEPPRGLTIPPPPPPAQPKPGDVVEVQGLTVTYLEHGAIQITGRDRWGAPLDTVYESSEFLRKALPTLERSVTPGQAASLRRLIAP